MEKQDMGTEERPLPVSCFFELFAFTAFKVLFYLIDRSCICK